MCFIDASKERELGRLREHLSVWNRLDGLDCPVSSRPGIEAASPEGLFLVDSHQSLKHWFSSGCAARRLALWGQKLGLVGLLSVYCEIGSLICNFHLSVEACTTV